MYIIATVLIIIEKGEYLTQLVVLKPYISKETDSLYIAYLHARATTGQYLSQDMYLACH